jgi:hypothetical protein
MRPGHGRSYVGGVFHVERGAAASMRQRWWRAGRRGPHGKWRRRHRIRACGGDARKADLNPGGVRDVAVAWPRAHGDVNPGTSDGHRGGGQGFPTSPSTRSPAGVSREPTGPRCRRRSARFPGRTAETSPAVSQAGADGLPKLGRRAPAMRRRRAPPRDGGQTGVNRHGPQVSMCHEERAVVALASSQGGAMERLRRSRALRARCLMPAAGRERMEPAPHGTGT